MKYKVKGWPNDNYRHSLAAKGISTGARRSFSARRYNFASVYDQTAPSAAPKTTNVMMDIMKESADDMLGTHQAVGHKTVMNNNPLSNSIGDSWGEWFGGVSKLAGKEHHNREMLHGGIADGMPNEAFEPAELQEGEMVEMEHTARPDIADEIAKDHLAEYGEKDEKGLIHSDYYPKLKEMENILSLKKKPAVVQQNMQQSMNPVEPEVKMEMPQ